MTDPIPIAPTIVPLPAVIPAPALLNPSPDVQSPVSFTSAVTRPASVPAVTRSASTAGVTRSPPASGVTPAVTSRVGRRPFLGAAAAVAVGLSGCLTTFAGGSSSRSTFDLDALPAGTRLDVDCDVGDVTLRRIEGETTRVVVTVTGAEPAAVERIGAQVVHEEPAGVVRVLVRDRTPGASTPLPGVAVAVDVPPSVVVGAVVTRRGTVVRDDAPDAPDARSRYAASRRTR